MGMNYHKKTVECECGINYGSCDKHNVWILAYNRSIDLGSLYYYYHIEEDNSKMVEIGVFTDNDINGLIDVLTSKTNESVEKTDLDKMERI